MEPKIVNLVKEINDSAPKEKDFAAMVSRALIPQGIEIPKPDLVFAINGITVFTKKSISTLIGKAKAGKTTVTSWIAAQSINQDTKVLWIDTEQGEYYGSRTQYWVLKIAGTATSPNLRYYDLKVYSPQERIEMIELIINEYRPDIVIVDGVRDLVYDINSPEEATSKTGHLMRWAEEYNTHILVILHQNKGNEHARGHLGTEMINKSETVIKVEQNQDKLIVCSPEFTRSKAFEPFAFDRSEDGMPYMVEGFSGGIGVTDDSVGRREKVNPWNPAYTSLFPEMIDFCFATNEYLTNSDLKGRIKSFMLKNGVDISEHISRGFKDRLFELEIIWENKYITGHAKIGKNPKYEAARTYKPPENVYGDGHFLTGEIAFDDKDPPF